jgi:hypothetical protein
MMGYYNLTYSEETGANSIHGLCLVSLAHEPGRDTSLVVFVDKLKKVIQIVPVFACLMHWEL